MWFMLFFYRCKRWVVNCRRKDLDGRSSIELNESFRLCSNHFEETMYYPTNVGGKRLILSAIPTIFDVPNPPAQVAVKRKAPAYRLFTPPTKKSQIYPDTLASGNAISDVGCYSKLKEARNALSTARVKICRLRKGIRKCKLKSKESTARPCDGSIEHILDLVQKYLSPDQIKFFQSQLKMSQRTKRGKRWTTADKLLALRIMFHSPQAFHSLRSVFCFTK